MLLVTHQEQNLLCQCPNYIIIQVKDSKSKCIRERCKCDVSYMNLSYTQPAVNTKVFVMLIKELKQFHSLEATVLSKQKARALVKCLRSPLAPAVKQPRVLTGAWSFLDLTKLLSRQHRDARIERSISQTLKQLAHFCANEFYHKSKRIHTRP